MVGAASGASARTGYAGTRSPGLQPQLESGFSGVPVAESEAALRALDLAVAMEHELPTDEALEAGASHERQELLIERAVEGPDLIHRTCLNTPITLPRIWT